MESCVSGIIGEEGSRGTILAGGGARVGLVGTGRADRAVFTGVVFGGIFGRIGEEGSCGTNNAVFTGVVAGGIGGKIGKEGSRGTNNAGKVALAWLVGTSGADGAVFG